MALPKKYHFVVNQLSKDFLKYSYENKSIGDEWFSFGFDQKQLEFFESSDINFQPRITSNIYIESNNNEKFNIELYFIAKGVFCAYKVYPNIDLEDITIKSVNSKDILENIFEDKELDLFKNRLHEISNSKIINYLDIEDSFFFRCF